uniref:Uncharacterized protein n=1 Tax=Rhizophora mucronata TaxID=61149 RepID=A0A2P2P5G8_RHIMU
MKLQSQAKHNPKATMPDLIVREHSCSYKELSVSGLSFQLLGPVWRQTCHETKFGFQS